MAAYSMPPSFSNKWKYGSSVLKFIDDEVIKSWTKSFNGK
jgi:hypothetical protein